MLCINGVRLRAACALCEWSKVEGIMCSVLCINRVRLRAACAMHGVRLRDACALQVGIAGSYGLWAVSHNFSLFVLARVLGGVSKGNVSLSTAIVSDVTRPEHRTKGMVSTLGVVGTLEMVSTQGMVCIQCTKETP